MNLFGVGATFGVAAPIWTQIEAGKPGALLESLQPKDVQATIRKLVAFLAADMRS